MEEYASLLRQLDLNHGIPYTPDWSAGADFIQIIVDACLQFKPSLILECSSGLTTLMLARCCQMNGQGCVVSLEDGEQYADKTRDYIDRYDLNEYASVIHAPLQKTVLQEVEYDWYADDSIPDKFIDMVVIDGPSGFIQKNSRYPALPILYERLSNNCRIFLDDAARPDEQAIVASWKTCFPNLSYEYRETGRGCSIFKV